MGQRAWPRGAGEILPVMPACGAQGAGLGAEPQRAPLAQAQSLSGLEQVSFRVIFHTHFHVEDRWEEGGVCTR